MKAQFSFSFFLRLLFLLFCGNLVTLYAIFPGMLLWKILVGILCGVLYLIVHFAHPHTMAGVKKLAVLAHGCAMLRISTIWFCIQVLLAVATLLWIPCTPAIQIANLCVFLLLCGLLFLGGLFRVAFSAKQIKIGWHIALFFWWWVPLLNLFLISHIYRTATRELHFECAKAELNAIRKESEICKTRYPILMVHGIFFRDWQYFNYWGRIPGELIRNGATIYYGNQQSAQSIQDSARELAAQIKTICAETGVEKVNIIAHSKGGLDCRYAIQEFGVAPYVATLTTINTPHHGCQFVDDLLQKVPSNIAQWLAKRYNTIFTKLGDTSPDFLRGVQELTVENCTKFHQKHPCVPGVAYLAVMSKMKSVRSAPFPLWLGYLLNQKRNGDNDGLVPVESAKLEGVPFTMVPETKKRGISHGDMIDLMRENIPGFDVREWYSQLVQQLKKNGF